MRRLCWAAALLLAGCHRGEPAAGNAPGDRLEAAAQAAGLVPDARNTSPVGSWAREGDRLCIVPGDAGRLRVGVSIDYGEGQQCAGRGTAERHEDEVTLRFGKCRIDARYDGERIALPAQVAPACDALCTGRATLAAVAVERLSGSASEAAMLRSPAGQALCGT